MYTLLYSKDSITKIEYSYTAISKYSVDLDYEVKNTETNCSCGFLWHFMNTYNSNIKIYVYKPKVNKDYILILPHIHITFSGNEKESFVFETDEQLDKFFKETGIHKIINTNKFFNPIEIANKIKYNEK